MLRIKDEDIIGHRFSRLTAISVLAERDKHKKRQVECQCDCGKTTIVPLSKLRNGNTRSCGCWGQEVMKQGREILRQRIANRVRPVVNRSYQCYPIWLGMKARCRDPKHSAWPRYGAKGVTVCERWKSSFKAFLEDMGERPFPSAEIDRIDGTKGYYPGNCRWVTRQENCRNRKTSIFVTFKGETITISEWADRLGVSRMTMLDRYHKGQSAEEMLLTPVKYKEATEAQISLRDR